MRRESFQGILLGIVIMCAVFAFITIAWATFNSTLTISGTAKINAVSWKVEFTDTINTAVSGATTLTGTVADGTSAVLPTSGALAIQSGGLTISGAVGELNREGDKITYKWYIQNFGNFNADITSSNLKAESTATPGRSLGNVSLNCTSQGGTANDKNSWCAENISAKLYVESYSATPTATNALNSSSNPLFSLPAADNASDNDVKVMFLVVEYVGSSDSNTDEVSGSEINVEIPTITFTATQNGAAVTTTTAAIGG